jgi:hypothetical protein
LKKKNGSNGTIISHNGGVEATEFGRKNCKIVKNKKIEK